MPVDALPGTELVERGVADLRAGRRSVEGLLVARAARRLRGAGVDVPDSPVADPGAELYDLLVDEGADAHGRYNALTRRLVSYLNARERAIGR